MRRTRDWLEVGAAGALVCLMICTSASAHHSFAAEFDGNQPVTLTGTVTKVEWRNPHIWVYLDVAQPDGTVVAWECEGGAPNALTRRGWSRSSLPLGAAIVVEGYRAKNGTNTCNATTWTVNGRTVLAGSAGEGRPEEGRQ